MDVRYLPDTLLQPCCLRTENKTEMKERRKEKCTASNNRGRETRDFLILLGGKENFYCCKKNFDFTGDNVAYL